MTETKIRADLVEAAQAGPPNLGVLRAVYRRHFGNGCAVAGCIGRVQDPQAHWVCGEHWGLSKLLKSRLKGLARRGSGWEAYVASLAGAGEGPTTTVEPDALAALANKVRKDLNGQGLVLDSREAIRKARRASLIGNDEANQALRRLASGNGSFEPLTPEAARAAIDAGKCPYDGRKLNPPHKLCDGCFKAGKLPALKELLGQSAGRPQAQTTRQGGKGQKPADRWQAKFLKARSRFEEQRPRLAELRRVAARPEGVTLEAAMDAAEDVDRVERFVAEANGHVTAGAWGKATYALYQAVNVLQLPGLIDEAQAAVDEGREAGVDVGLAECHLAKAHDLALDLKARVDAAHAARRMAAGAAKRAKFLVSLESEAQPQKARKDGRRNGRSADAAQRAQQMRTLDRLRQQYAAEATNGR